MLTEAPGESNKFSSDAILEEVKAWMKTIPLYSSTEKNMLQRRKSHAVSGTEYYV